MLAKKLETAILSGIVAANETAQVFGGSPNRQLGAPAPYLPMSRAELDRLGWDCLDVVLVTGDAYVDHPSFGAAVVGRLLEAHGFRVGIIAQPDWRSPQAFMELGRPALFFGITAGNMDSMVNRYTADRRLRSDDAYSPDGAGGMRPDRAVIVYSQRVREAFKGVPLVLGGIEASLRRFSHYDYWSDQVRRSILLDSRADLLIYGNAERALVEVARRVAKGEDLRSIRDVRGTAFVREPWSGDDGVAEAPVRLPAHEELVQDSSKLAEAARSVYLETNPHNARALVQRHKDKDVWINPPPLPLSTTELDSVFELPFARKPHPAYGSSRIPAWEMIRFSVSITRGCFGGCSFCAIALHEGRIVQSRSNSSVAKELESVRDLTPGFTGVISDLGGPTANMYRLGCRDEAALAKCRRLSCLYPSICPRLDTDHRPLIELYRRSRKQPGIKKVLVASGLRHDLALLSPEYIEELVTHHVGGLLKLAPEHTEPGPLGLMMKPGIRSFERFAEAFEGVCKRAGKVQHIVPYFIAAHPGTSTEDMLKLALWLRKRGLRVDQVQNFLPTPSTLSTAMYASGRNPLASGTTLYVPKGGRERRLQKAFLRHHDPEEWPLLREALLGMGRRDLIGGGPDSLAPRRRSTGEAPVSPRRSAGKRASGDRRNDDPRSSKRSNKKGRTR